MTRWFTIALSPYLPRTRARRPPSRFQVGRRIHVSRTLRQFQRARVSINRGQVLLVHIRNASYDTGVTTFPIAGLQGTLARFKCFPFMDFRHPGRSVQHVSTRNRFTVFRANTPLDNRRVRVVARTVRVQHLDPRQFRAMSTPCCHLTQSHEGAIVSGDPDLQVGTLNPSLNLTFPLQVSHEANLNPMRVTIPILRCI